MNTRREKQKSVNFLAGVFLISSLCVLGAHSAAQAANSDIVISEIGAYEASDYEWIEIFNKGLTSVDLDGWVFYENATNHGLAAYQGSDLIIEAGEYAIIADVALNFKSKYPEFLGTIIDSAWTTLDAAGELIELRTSATPAAAVESFTYIPTGAYSLERANPFLSDYTALNWQTHASGNTAGAQNSNYTAGAGICGNGIVEAGEECDDNNILDSDGCSAQCLLEEANGVDGTVLLTITPNALPVRNIQPTAAEIVFQLNGAGDAMVKYGATNAYGLSSSVLAAGANTDITIALSGLTCGTLYHYAIYAENTASGEFDQSADAVFTTLPCGIVIDSLNMAKTAAKANNDYENGWEWNFALTVWDMEETKLKMKFESWTGAGALAAGGNMRFSADNGANWVEIASDGAYPVLSATIASIDESANAGRQVNLIVQMKVPSGTLAGNYNSSYGILTEK